MRSPANPKPQRRSFLRALGSLAVFALVSAGFIGVQSFSAAPPAQAAVTIRNLDNDRWAWATSGPWRQVYSVEVSMQVGESVNIAANYTNQNNFRGWYSKNEYNATAANGKIPTSANSSGQIPAGLRLTPDMNLTGKVADSVRPGTYYVKYGFRVWPNAVWGSITMWGVYKIEVRAKPTQPAPPITTVIQPLDGDSWGWAGIGYWRQVYSMDVTVGRGNYLNVAPNITSYENYVEDYQDNVRTTSPNGKLPSDAGTAGQMPEGLWLDRNMRLLGAVSSDVKPGTYYVKYGMKVVPNAVWGTITMWGVYRVNVKDDPKPIPAKPVTIAPTNSKPLWSDDWAWASHSPWRQVRSREIQVSRGGMVSERPNYYNKHNFRGEFPNENYRQATSPNGRIPWDKGTYGQLPKGLTLRADNTLQGTVSSDVRSGTYYVKYGFNVYPNFFWGTIKMWGVYKIVVR